VHFLSLVGKSLPTAVDHEPHFPHELLSIAVDNENDLRTWMVVPATKLIAKLIVKSGHEDQLKRARLLMGQQTGCCLGKSFEPYATLMLSSPGTHHIRRIYEEKDEGTEEEELITGDWPTQEVPNSAFLGAGLGALLPNVMYTPQDPSFPCIDAWIATDMFQMKSGHKKTKEAKTGAPRFQQVCDLVTNKRIIYVVPKGKGDPFTYVPQTVPDYAEEWVLEMPL